ncbi:MAG: hypothetical protein ACFCVB_16105 [Nodosilinea sp.]
MRILLAEDNPDQLEPMQMALEREHHIVDPAKGRRAAVDQRLRSVYF